MIAPKHARTLQLVLAGLLLAWAWKATILMQALALALGSPLEDAFFPALLRDPWLLGGALTAPIALALPALVRPTVARFVRAFAGTFVCALVLLLHQASYNDASFLSAFWCSLYALWLLACTRAGIDPALLARRASLLARCVVALMFFGGFVGKLTPGYWDGSVFYDIYFAERDYGPFNLARAWLSPDGLHSAARIYARVVVCSEGLLATLPLWPGRAALWVALVALIAMVALNNPLLLSVLGPLMGVCLAALRAGAREPAASRMA